MKIIINYQKEFIKKRTMNGHFLVHSRNSKNTVLKILVTFASWQSWQIAEFSAKNLK